MKSIVTEKKLQKEKLTFEEILEKSGGFGTFQFLILVTLLLPEIPASFIAFAPVFAGKAVKNWTCEVDVEDNNFNENGTELLGICDCVGRLHFDGDTSIVSEWGLVCDRSWVSDSITSIQMLGMLLGSLFSSQISDWYGRKWVYFGVCCLMGLGQAVSAISPNPLIYAIARFFAGAGISGFMGMSTIYPLEFMTPDWRLLVGSVGPWGQGIMLFALFAYYVNPWRQLLFYSSLAFIPVLVLVPFLSESPRWLLRQGRVNETLQVLTKIQMVNGKQNVNVTFEMLEEIRRNESDNNGMMVNARFSYLDFFREKELRRRTILLMGIWFSWSMVYFGISYNVKNLQGDPYLNVFFMGLSDAIGYPTALLFNNKLGRRKSLVIFMFLGAIFLVTLATLELFYGSLISTGTVAFLTLSGKFGIAGARSAARMLTGESFPTAIRTMRYGISGVTAGFGGIIAPQIAYFGSLWWAQLPFVTFAVISVAGSLLSLLLPETAGKNLSEEMALMKNKKNEKLYHTDPNGNKPKV